MIVFQYTQEFPPVGIIAEDIPPFIASAGHMVHCPGVFYSQRSSHNELSLEGKMSHVKTWHEFRDKGTSEDDNDIKTQRR